jgi:hypothetical protein
MGREQRSRALKPGYLTWNNFVGVVSKNGLELAVKNRVPAKRIAAAAMMTMDRTSMT